MGRKSSYENGMYQQLMEIMGRLDTIEKEHKKETGELKTEIADLKKKICSYARKTNCSRMIIHV